MDVRENAGNGSGCVRMRRARQCSWSGSASGCVRSGCCERLMIGPWVQSSAHRPPHWSPHTPQFRSQTPSHPTVLLTDPFIDPPTGLFTIVLASTREFPGTPRHQSFNNVSQVWCIIEAAEVCGWWPKIALLPGKLQISHRRLPIRGERKSLRNLWEICDKSMT